MDIIKRLNTPVDNGALVLFRMLFGLLLAWQAVLSVSTGWVYENFIRPKFTFSHIGMEWLQPLPGNGMYWYFWIMAALGVFIAVGLWYRLSMLAYAVLWTGVYFMQKTSYNNHYYLLMLLCYIMALLPANTYVSVDAKLKPSLKSSTMPIWCRYIIILQIGIVYFYASIAKLYPGWLDGTFTAGILNRAARHYCIAFFRERWMHIFLAYAGILFDFCIVPAMLYRKTRPYAVTAAFIFHLFNSATLYIGIFPYLSLALLLFFIPAERITKICFPKKNLLPEPVSRPTYIWWPYVFVPYFIFQVLMPLRHHLIKGDVVWTEEGHRLSWRMMLRKRTGYAEFKIQDKKTGETWLYDTNDVLTPLQKHSMQTRPDMLWQMAQYIKHEYSVKGINVAIFITAKTSVNHKTSYLLIDPKVDMAAAKWDYYWHNEWILTYEGLK